MPDLPQGALATKNLQNTSMVINNHLRITQVCNGRKLPTLPASRHQTIIICGLFKPQDSKSSHPHPSNQPLPLHPSPRNPRKSIPLHTYIASRLRLQPSTLAPGRHRRWDLADWIFRERHCHTTLISLPSNVRNRDACSLD